MKPSALKAPMLILLWTLATGAGFGVLLAYRGTPGPRPAAAASLPPSVPVQARRGQTILIMLAHPRCPCSRASIGELAWLMGRSYGTTDAHVFFVEPAGVGAGWAQGELWNAARAIPGVTVHRDEDGAVARALGGSTSGVVFVYGSEGRLRYRGGITDGRGHAGANHGRATVSALLAGQAVTESDTAVFGCALTSDSAKPWTWRRPWEI